MQILTTRHWHLSGMWFIIAFIFLLGIMVQQAGLLGTDMSWLMHATQRFLNGGTYTQDFFEINPPTVFYIHIPPVLLAHFFGMSDIAAFRLYVFLIAIISFLLCNALLKSVIRFNHRRTYYCLMVALALDFVLLPGMHFGQREHIAVMLIMPYLFLMMNLALRESANVKITILTAVMAGVGFSIKPHFIFTFLLAELYLCFCLNSWRLLFRPEPLIISAIFIASIISIFILTPEYLQLVPYIRDFFSLFAQSFNEWVLLFTNLKVMFVMGVLLMYMLLGGKIMHALVGRFLMIGVVGFFLSYAIEPLFLHYHTIPMVSLAILLAVFMLSEYSIRVRQPVVLLIVSILVLWIPFYVVVGETILVFHRKNVSPIPNLLAYTQNLSSNQTIYFFTTDAAWTYPLVDYAGVESASRFESFWFLPYIVHLANLNDAKSKQLKATQTQFFTQMVTQDLEKGKPAYVFVDNVVGWRLFDDVNFDYIAFFSELAAFRAVWQHYQRVGEVGRIAVYERRQPH